VAHGTRVTPPSQHLLDFLRHLIDRGIPVLLDPVEDPAPWLDRPQIKLASSTMPIIESNHSSG